MIAGDALAIAKSYTKKSLEGQGVLKGDKGDKGDTYTPVIGNVTTVDNLVDASASIELDESTLKAKINLSIPKGANGDKGATGEKGANGVTPTIKAAAGANIGTVGTPSVTASTSGTTTTFTFNNLKGEKGEKGTNATTTAVATTSANGLMSKEDKTKLNGIASGANKYVLPTASASTLGGVKIGGSLQISNGVLNLVWQ